MLLMESPADSPSRRVWVSDPLRLRGEQGEQATFMQEAKMSRDDFHSYYRMSPERFDELLTREGSRISKQETVMLEPIPEEAP